MTHKMILFGCVLAASCARSSDVPAPRFANAPPVARVDDRRDVSARPTEREFLHSLYHYDGIVQRRLSRALEVPRTRRALGTNALDEVPDSTWFTNRIGVRELTLDELRAGPNSVGSPEPHKPWTVHSTKTGGSEIGLMVTDARGAKFLLKFDMRGYPEQETATHAIVGRLLWACGLNVTEDHVVFFAPEDLVVAPDAVVKDVFDNKRPMHRADLDELIARLNVVGPGRYRGLASMWLEGKPLGGPPAEGVREGDVNDRIPHELRRDLRGTYAMFAWLDHVDAQESNFLDMWIEDHGRHYIKHYALDFGKALGVMNTTGTNRRHGREYVVDFSAMAHSFVTLGLARRPWEGLQPSQLRGVGMLQVDGFDPGAWKPDSPAYVPFLNADRFDKFWAAKILIRFTREQIHAAVEAGRLSDPRAVEYITDALVGRQRATARYWFERVNPLDRFEVAASPASTALCFDDLNLVYALGAEAAATRYRITSYDIDGRVLGQPQVAQPSASGRACSAALTLAAPFAGYTIVRVETVRPGFTDATFVHVARDPTSGIARVIGLWRP